MIDPAQPETGGQHGVLRRVGVMRPTGRRAVVAAFAILGAAAVWISLRGAPAARVAASPALASGDVHTLARRDFTRIVRLTGLTEATRSHVVSVPLLAGSSRGSLTLTHLVPTGTSVRAGDLLVRFDAQAQETAALARQVEYRDLVEQIAKKRAEHDAARVKDESELQQAANAVQKYELEILKNEMLARIKAEENEQRLDEARAKHKALKENFALEREAARADMRILEIRRDRALAAMQHAQRNVAAMTIRSPLDGIVVTKSRWRGNGIGDVQEGDDLFPGTPVLEVVNQASMRVRARINQADLSRVSAGQPVTVRLDAYPDLALPGHLAQVSPIATPGSFSNRVRSFVASITIEGTSARLLPDLTAAVDVETERVPAALVVPRDALRQQGARTLVRVRAGADVAEREVELGPQDEVDAVVLRGLEPGQVVLRHWR